MFALHDKFKIKIIFKSGASHEFWTYKFKVSAGKVEWMSCSLRNRLIDICVEEIAAVVQVGYRKGIFGKKEPQK